MVSASTAFKRHLRTALNSLYDPSVLRDSPLAELLDVDQRPGTVSALRRTLIDAIESLKPIESTPAGARTWRVYHILRRRYTEQVTQRKVAADLGLSIRQLQREEKLAREVLADYLWTTYDLAAREQASALSSPQAGDQPGAADVQTLTRTQELAKFKSTVPTEMTDVRDLIAEVLETAGPLLGTSGVCLEVSEPERSAPVSLQAALLRQALLNLVTAATHCAAGRRVSVRHEVLPDRVCIWLCAATDEGALPAWRQQCDESLKMAEQLIELCQGSLEIALSQDTEHAAGAVGEGILRIKATLPVAGQVSVLVIDDNADALQLFQRYLAGSRYRFVGAQDAQRGMAMAVELIPEIIVLDVMMPEKDGWTLLGSLRAHPKTRGIPVVVSTILPQKELAFALGAADFIRKPVSRAELLSALDRQLGQRPRRSC